MFMNYVLPGHYINNIYIKILMPSSFTTASWWLRCFRLRIRIRTWKQRTTGIEHTLSRGTWEWCTIREIVDLRIVDCSRCSTQNAFTMISIKNIYNWFKKYWIRHRRREQVVHQPVEVLHPSLLLPVQEFQTHLACHLKPKLVWKIKFRLKIQKLNISVRLLSATAELKQRNIPPHWHAVDVLGLVWVLVGVSLPVPTSW